MLKSRDTKYLIPSVRLLCEQMFYICWLTGFKIFVTDTYRDNEYQDWLYEQGRTRPGEIVTDMHGGKSLHNHTDSEGNPASLAFDIAFRPDDNPRGATWIGDWYAVGEIGELLGLAWGGRWYGYNQDKPHFQLNIPII